MSDTLDSILSVIVTDTFKSSESADIVVFLPCWIEHAYSIYSACKIVIECGYLIPDRISYFVLISVGIVEILYVFTVVSIIGLLRQGGGGAAALGSLLTCFD